jgi:hypothetical protein
LEINTLFFQRSTPAIYEKVVKLEGNYGFLVGWSVL